MRENLNIHNFKIQNSKINFINFNFIKIVFLWTAFLLSNTILFNLSLFAQNEKTFENANNLYKSQKYTEALELYHNIEKTGLPNSELFFNIGNSYYRLEDWGNAILYFEKAKKLSPSDDDIQFNLKMANLKIIDKFNDNERVTLFDYYISAISVFHSNTWVYISIISFILLLIFVYQVIYSKSESTKRFNFLMAIISLFTFVIITTFAYSTYTYNTTNTYAIMIDSNSMIKNAPDSNSQDLIMIHSGTKLQILELNDNWAKVKLPDGNVGWIDKTTIKEI